MKSGRLTYNGYENGREVQNVQAVGEVVPSERDDLQEELNEKDDDEDEVDTVQNGFCLVALLVRLYHFGHYVQADQRPNDHLKRTSGHQVKEPSLALVLRDRREIFQTSGPMLLKEVVRKTTAVEITLQKITN